MSSSTFAELQACFLVGGQREKDQHSHSYHITLLCIAECTPITAYASLPAVILFTVITLPSANMRCISWKLGSRSGNWALQSGIAYSGRIWDKSAGFRASTQPTAL